MSQNWPIVVPYIFVITSKGEQVHQPIFQCDIIRKGHFVFSLNGLFPQKFMYYSLRLTKVNLQTSKDTCEVHFKTLKEHILSVNSALCSMPFQY